MRHPFLYALFSFLTFVSAKGLCNQPIDRQLRETHAISVPDIIEQQTVYTEVEIEPVLLDFNTIALSTDELDQELFYWTQQDVSLRKQVRFLIPAEVQKRKVVPDFFVHILILDFKIERNGVPSYQSGLSTDSRELVASGKIRLIIQSASDEKVMRKKNLFAVYRKYANYRLRVDSSRDNVHDPATQGIFNAWFSENQKMITDELNGYFNISAAQ